MCRVDRDSSDGQCVAAGYMQLSDLIFVAIFKSSYTTPGLFRDKKQINKKGEKKHRRDNFCQRSVELDIGFGQRLWSSDFVLCSTASNTASTSPSVYLSIRPSIH